MAYNRNGIIIMWHMSIVLYVYGEEEEEEEEENEDASYCKFYLSQIYDRLS